VETARSGEPASMPRGARTVFSFAGALLLAGLALLMGGCLNDEVKGSGNAVTEDRNVSGFTELRVQNALTVEVQIGEPQSVTVTGDDNIVKIIETDVSGDQLTVRAEKDYSTKTPLSVAITVPHLTALDVSGASNVTVAGLNEPELEIEASGASEVTVSGSAGQIDVEASGASRLHLENLAVRQAEVDASGASTIGLQVSDSLTGDASGASTIGYSGSPQVDVDTSGASSVRQQ